MRAGLLTETIHILELKKTISESGAEKGNMWKRIKLKLTAKTICIHR